MKRLLITLKDGRSMVVEAQGYRKEGHQYVFDGTSSGEVEFVLVEHVIAITTLPESNVSGGGAW